MTIAPIGIEAYSAISNLGSSASEIKQALINNEIYLEVDDYSLVENKTAWVGRIHQEFPSIDYLNDPYSSRYTQIADSVLTDLLDSIEIIKIKYPAHRIGVIIGTSTSGIADNESFIMQASQTGHISAGWSYKRHALPTLADMIQNRFQFKGPAMTISTACSSGAKMFASAARWIYADFCDAVLVGGIDTLCRLSMNGFNSLESLSTQMCRPFSQNRDGINLGEAAAFFIVSKQDCLIQLLGFGESSDAYHISSPHPDGKGAITAMQQALILAGLDFHDIDYLNLHGTGTIKNDEMEGKAVKAVFKDYPILISSTKHKTGHCLAAAGALEAYFCCEILREQNNIWLPWNQNDNIAEEFSDLNFVSQTSTLPRKIYTTMSNSFAFGGSNCSLIFGVSSHEH